MLVAGWLSGFTDCVVPLADSLLAGLATGDMAGYMAGWYLGAWLVRIKIRLGKMIGWLDVWVVGGWLYGWVARLLAGWMVISLESVDLMIGYSYIGS